MADKSTALSIIIRAVDQSSAKIQAINARLATLTSPIKDSSKAFGELRDHLGMLGLDAVKDGFSGVGRAVGDLLSKAAVVGGVIAGAAVTAVIELKSLVDEFATLGHTAERAGVEVDFLAGMRYSAEKAGVPVEALDGALVALTQNMGQAKAGTGRMLKFLNEVSPALAQQVVHAHGTAEALGLLAAAMHKLPDAARRAALAQKTLGDAALAPVLAKGSAAIQEQLVAYGKLAGSQDEAVKGALGVEESMVDMKAATDGVKAALVSGLSPALRIIVDQMTVWLVGHRADVQQWAEDIGKKLPGAVDEIVKTIKGAIKWVTDFVDGIGGWKVAVELVAAAMLGPLAASLAALSVALLATPFGQVLLLMTPIVAAIAAMVSKTEAFESIARRLGFLPKLPTPEQSFQSDMDAMMEDGRRAAKSEADARAALDSNPVVQQNRRFDEHQRLVEQHAVPALTDAPTATEIAMEQLRQLAMQQPKEAKIKIEITGAPKGTRASVAPGSTADVDLSTGYQMMGAGT